MDSAPPLPIIIRDLFEIPKNPGALKWEYFREGVKIHRLYGNQQTGPSAALLWYDAASGIPTHEHLGYEHILVLSNAQHDGHRDNAAGTLMISPPGSSHTISVRDGAIVLAIWEKPVRFHTA